MAFMSVKTSPARSLSFSFSSVVLFFCYILRARAKKKSETGLLKSKFTKVETGLLRNRAFAKKNCSKGSKIGILATESTLRTKIYHKFFEKKYSLIEPPQKYQKTNVNKSIELVKKGKVKEAERIIKPAIRYLLKMKCKKIILACTELPVAIFAFKSFKKVKSSKTFFDPNLILAKAAMKKYKLKSVK